MGKLSKKDSCQKDTQEKSEAEEKGEEQDNNTMTHSVT